MLDPAWLPFRVKLAGVDTSRTKLLCFPFAGGGASTYAPWVRLPPADVTVLPVQLPGREHRIAERPFDSMVPLLDALMETLIAPLEGDLALFGHSMGALIAAELAQRMTQAGRPPVRLFASGFPPPNYPRAGRMLHTLPRDAMLSDLAKLNGLRPEVLAHPELVELILPILYADLRLEELHDPLAAAPLPCPITVFAGDDDLLTRGGAIPAWREATRRECAIHRFAGDHFFLLTRLSQVLELVAADLAAAHVTS